MDSPSPRRPWLRAADQLAAGVLIALALVAIGLHHWWQGGLQGRLIEIETAEPLLIQYQVDINRASAEEFLILPEIGETLAQRIVEDRTARGPFRSHADLQRVRGIGPKTLERLRPYLLPMPDDQTLATH